MKLTLTVWFGLMLSLLAAMPDVASAASAASAETRYVDVNGARIAYRQIGAGSPILLANRMRGTIDTWDPLFLDGLAQEHTVITFDYPGIGYSSGRLPEDMGKVATFIKDLADGLKLEKFAILGWSWGGFASQTLLVDHPGRATHAILVGTNPPGKNQMPIEPLFLERAFKPVNDLADEEILFFEPKSKPSLTAAKASHERIYARPGVTAHIPSTKEDIQLYINAHATFREDAAGRRTGLTQTRTPMLILCGDNDISNRVENWYSLVGKIPNGHLIVYPETGHGPQHQYPELAARQIIEFLKHAVN